MHQLKKILSLFFLLAFSQIVFAATITISNCDELQNINSKLDGNYVLINDINCFGKNFIPISGYKAIFDGNNKKMAL